MKIRRGKVIVDTNLLMQALDYRKHDVFNWIDHVYESVYVHIEVINEFRIESERKSVMKVIEDRGWNIFNHNNEESLPDQNKALYWKYVNDIRQGFKNLKEKKEEQGRIPKTTNDIGEIHCIALAQLISGNIISSNDFEIREVIEDEDIRVYSADVDDDVLIEQDTIEDFCFYCVQAGVAKPSSVVNFFKICRSGDSIEKLKDKVAVLRKRLSVLLE